MIKNLMWLLLSVLVIGLDQYSKLRVSQMLLQNGDVTILNGFDLSLAYNYGAAFSFLSQASGWQQYFFIAIAVFMSVFLLVWLYRLPDHQRGMACALALILGGAWGNLIDRISYGYVIDFIAVYYQNWHFPTFNVADSAICLGAALICFYSWRNEKV